MMNSHVSRIGLAFSVITAAIAGCAEEGARELGSTAADESTSTSSALVVENRPNSCLHLPAGPIEATVVMRGLDNTEDFVFDRKGHFVALKPNASGTNDIVLVDAAQNAVTLAGGFGQTLGMRYRPDGTLLAALLNEDNPPASGVIAIAPDGAVNRDYAGGLAIPNGIATDFDGNAWVTEFAGDRILRIGPDGAIETIVSDSAETPVHRPNGIVFDSARRALLYTSQSADGAAGEIWSMSRRGCHAKPAKVVTLPQKQLDGLALDACGNLYGVAKNAANAHYEVYRVRLDALGGAASEVETIADISDLPSSASSLQFGSGPGFDPRKLYVVGPQGVLYAVPVGITGAPVPAPPR